MNVHLTVEFAQCTYERKKERKKESKRFQTDVQIEVQIYEL